MPGRFSQRVDRIMRHENEQGTFSLIVKTGCGIFPPNLRENFPMSDELIRLPGAMEPVTCPGIQHHWCERPGCGKDAGWGFAKPKQASHCFCFEHRGDGEKYL